MTAFDGPGGPAPVGVDVWLARHGETEWSRSGRHTGTTDLPLTARGERQARELGRRLRGHRFARVCSSPMSRARQTAALAGFDDAEISDFLREYDYGAYEGRTTDEIQAERPGWELFRDGCPGGEEPSQIAARVTEWLSGLGRSDGDVLVFGHGHCLRALAAVYLGGPIALAGVLRLDAGSLSILGHEHGHAALQLWNETPGG
ncbi:MAG TPA: histidine phosphatase family protein [Actinomycetota bacterium]